MIYALDGDSPEIHETAWVADNATVIGKVVLGAESSVWFNVTLRGDNEPIVIGAGSNVQENVVVHNDPGCPVHVGENCTIGHKALLHGCRIGDGALIGMGAIILNGAVIGEGSLIGAGALITEGKEIPPGSLVMGAPGKVVRALDEAGRAGLLRSAELYRARARQFRAGLREIT